MGRTCWFATLGGGGGACGMALQYVMSAYRLGRQNIQATLRLDVYRHGRKKSKAVPLALCWRCGHQTVGVQKKFKNSKTASNIRRLVQIRGTKHGATEKRNAEAATGRQR